jgi:hypothetical protein
MALMKAKTANAKAKSVDKRELALQSVADSITTTVAVGEFGTRYYSVGYDEIDDYVVLALKKAGYSVVPDSIPALIYTPPRKASTWYEKLFSWIPRIDDVHPYDDFLLDYRRAWVVSWELIREPQSTKA